MISHLFKDYGMHLNMVRTKSKKIVDKKTDPVHDQAGARSEILVKFCFSLKIGIINIMYYDHLDDIVL